MADSESSLTNSKQRTLKRRGIDAESISRSGPPSENCSATLDAENTHSKSISPSEKTLQSVAAYFLDPQATIPVWDLGDKYGMLVDLCNVKLDEVKVEVVQADRLVIITAPSSIAKQVNTRKVETKESKNGYKRYHVPETILTTLTRIITLPDSADLDNVNANIREDKLTIGCLKKEVGSKTKRNIVVTFKDKGCKLKREVEDGSRSE